MICLCWTSESVLYIHAVRNSSIGKRDVSIQVDGNEPISGQQSGRRLMCFQEESQLMIK